jgi:integrase
VEIKDGLLASEVKIGDLILYYLQEQAEVIATMPTAKRRELLGMIERLSAFWGDLFVSEIKRKKSLEYQKDRKQSVVRNELIAFRAIINFCASEGKVKKYDGELNYAIPPALTARMHYYSMEEFIALYKAARRKRHMWHGKPTHRVATHIARFMLVAALTGSRTGDIITASFYNEPGRPWVDLESQIYYRAADGERVPHNKKANPCRIPDRLVDIMKRWRDGYGKVKPSRYLVEFAGEAADCKKAFLRLRREVMSEERAAQLNRHSFKHTCVTWLLQAGVPIEDVSIYVSTDVQTLRKTYSHVIPGEYSPVNQAFARKKRVGSETRRDRFLGEEKAA